MTYLELVNNILRRLRERTVSSVTESQYSTLIGILVNDALREVEDAWDWSALRTTLTATTSSGNFSYTLTGSGNRITILDVLNDTDDIEMTYKEAKWMNKQFLLGSADTGSPMYYSFNGVDSAGDTITEVYPIPDDAYTIRYNVVQRTEELVNNTDTVTVPSRPILALAYAKAIEERGEDAGVNSSSAYAVAARSLNDAISLDAAKHPEELIWSEV